jgi:hypothetical protein
MKKTISIPKAIGEIQPATSRRMSGDSIGAFWSCLFSNFWVAAEGRSSEPFKATCLATAFRAFPIDDRLKCIALTVTDWLSIPASPIRALLIR